MPTWTSADAQVSIYYEVAGEAGEGPWLTLINGHTRSSSDFKLWSRRLASMGARVLSFDNRGAGQTRSSGAFTLADMVGDVRQLWQALAITSSGVLGISMGGFIAARLALEAPQQVSRLALISTAGDRSYLRLEANDQWPADLPGIAEKLATYFAPAFHAKNRLLVQAMAKQIYSAVTDGDFRAGAAAQRAALATAPAQASDLSRISCPSLVVHGGADAIIPVAAAYELQAQIPGARLQVWPEAGHLLLAEKPVELYELIADFFVKGS